MWFINQVLEKYTEYTKPLCMAFIDYATNLWLSGNLSSIESSHEKGVEEIFMILEDICKEITATIKLHMANI